MKELKSIEDIAKPIIGKTYSLYGGENSSDNFFEQITLTADEILSLSGRNEIELINLLSKLSGSKKRIFKNEKTDPFISGMMSILRKDFSKYLVNVEEHLKSISFLQMWDRRLSTSFEQYLLYVLEIELTNRIYSEEFLQSGKKLAFLPHCLRDFSKNCMASPDELDHLCKGCSKQCTINSISKLLKQSEVTPYIWLKADLKKLFKTFKNNSENPGVLGIACIPELVFGMRLCRKYNIPVVGIPLDANRCSRWMGDFYNNSVNTNKLNKILYKKSPRGSVQA
ncbi:MAG TPA: DUF116 domain-containing protein [Ignavibacteria bacterium]